MTTRTPIQFSVLITSRNEGESLRRTVDAVLCHTPKDVRPNSRTAAFELVIVDDGSDDGSAEFLDLPEYREAPIRTLRNDSARGLICSRAQAADHARGRFIAFLDAHCQVPEGWLERLAGWLERVGFRGIVAPLIYRLNAADWSVDRNAPPASGCSVVSPFFDFDWRPVQRVDGLPATCTIGGGAWMCTAEWYRHIGGLDRDMVFWGGENIDVPLKTWVAGGWCLVAEDVGIGHLFRPQTLLTQHRANTARATNLTYNKIRAAHNVFSKPTFEKIIRNFRFLPAFTEALDRIGADSASLAKMNGYVESIRVRPDEWLLETFSLPILEAPFFYRRRVAKPKIAAAPRTAQTRARPLVSIVLFGGDALETSRSVESIRSETRYGNYEVIAMTTRTPDAERVAFPSPRVRHLDFTSDWSGSRATNAATAVASGDLLVMAEAGIEIMDPHWLEKLILVFDRRVNLLMVSPRIVRSSATAESGHGDAEFEFDVTWDWETPGFARSRRAPVAEVPYQALCSSPVCHMVQAERLNELGGYDRTIQWGALPVLDLAIRGWLRGYESFCHPGVAVAMNKDLEDAPENGATPEERSRREYAQVLPALKSFTNPRRLLRCRERSPEADALLAANRFYIDRRRRELASEARFDDDWLFYKFSLEE